ncbi:hypothetical protein EDD86DRAFT_272057 [Gorgonomyces haynaldii]|nr:hypothetical protein EDD86DRAFT_272057 [Gorgonomyces haynaldii]
MNQASEDCAIVRQFWPKLKTYYQLHPTNCCLPDRFGQVRIMCFQDRVRQLTLEGVTSEVLKQVMQLDGVRVLIITNSELVEPLPDEIGKLPLTYLSIIRSNITGSLPSSFGNLSSLQVLNMMDTTLTGPLPQELGNLKMLSSLHLADNPGIIVDNRVDWTIAKWLARLELAFLLNGSSTGIRVSILLGIAIVLVTIIAIHIYVCLKHPKKTESDPLPLFADQTVAANENHDGMKESASLLHSHTKQYSTF